VSALTSVPIGSLSFDRFEPILPAERYRQLMEAADHARELFAGRRVWNINSTARGGGVAEMLVSLLAYAHGAGVDARWIVISGNEPFFTLTKRIHNNLHSSPGDGGELGDAERQVYESALQPNVDEFLEMVTPDDVVIVHDPQPAARSRSGWACRSSGAATWGSIPRPTSPGAPGASCGPTSSPPTPTCSRARRSCGRAWTTRRSS
jgi:trehalose synthase